MRDEKGKFVKGHQTWLGKKRLSFSKKWRDNIGRVAKGNKSRTGLKNSELSNEKRRQWSIKNGFQKKENHPYYIKDRTQLKTDSEHQYDIRYKEWMLEVKKRDKWMCKIKNQDCKGKMEAHHILRWSDYPELRYEINNGITLCHFHHPRKRVEENMLVPFFSNLLK